MHKASARRGVLRTVAGVIVAAASVSYSSGQQATTVQTLNYNKDTFYIPFDAKTLARGMATTEVLLFVSGDRGASWQLYQRQAPTAKRFAFRAAIDGEYWFAVRTLDAESPEPSTDGLQPELKVVLDTKKPELDLSAALLSESEAGIVWGIQDKNLDPNTLRMEYRTSSIGVWQPILPSAVKQIDNGYRGETTWQLAQPTHAMEIRASVKDAAGNETRLADTIRPVHQTSSNGIDESDRHQSPDLGILGSVPVNAPARTGDLFLQPKRTRQPPIAHANDVAGWQTNRAAQPSPIRVDTVPTAPIIENHTLKPASEVVNRPGTNDRLTTTAQAQPPVASRVLPSRPSHPQVRMPTETTPSLPAPTQAHLSASRQFHLDYDVEATNTDNVARVALWATVDNGQTWQLYGEDPDRISPFLVDVPEDGIYGFRMLIENSDGIAPRAPVSGDSADVWIHVDATKPTARIVSARFGRNANLGQLQIYWDAADQNLTETPVTLLYSDRPDGPWRVIAEQLKNTGRFDWNVKESVPSNFYLQLEVRDTAGNMTRDTLRDPMSRDGLAPRGVIRDVRPATDDFTPGLPATPSGELPLPSTMQTPSVPQSSESSLRPTQPSDGPSLGPAQVPASLDYP